MALAPSVVLVQTAVADYRQRVLDLLVADLGDRFTLYVGRCYFEPSVETRIDLGDRVRIVRNRFFANRRALFQHGVIVPAVRSDVAILELNPRIVSVWVTLLARRTLGKRSIIWGHAWSRRGPHLTSNYVRRLMWRLAGVVLLYTRQQAAEVLEWAPETCVVVAPNALYAASEIAPVTAEGARGFIYVGRLVASKKPGLLLRAFFAALEDLGDDGYLTFVGDGPLRAELEREVSRESRADRVAFLGHIGSRSVLEGLYAGVLASVSPGYAGLSLIQSLSFGVPMIIASEDPHGPEIAAAEDEVNCARFEADNADALSAVLNDFVRNRGSWLDRRAAIAASCAVEYSVEAMAAGIEEAVDLAVRPSR